MKKGDVVTIQDSSYSFAIVDGFLEHHPGEVQKECQVIIAVDCDLPADWGCHGGSLLQRNDTIVRGQISGKITFVQQRFCHSVHKVMIDCVYGNCVMYGQIIEISDKLYQEIKRES